MTLLETNSSPQKIYNQVVSNLKKLYDVIEMNGERVFAYSETKYFVPLLFPPPWDAIVIEYNGFDEGELFYLEDYNSIDTLMKDILQEIEK